MLRNSCLNKNKKFGTKQELRDVFLLLPVKTPTYLLTYSLSKDWALSEHNVKVLSELVRPGSDMLGW